MLESGESIPTFLEFSAMDSVAIRDVKQLPGDEKRSLESIVGRRLDDSQQVFILAFTPGVIPSDAARQGAMAGLIQTWESVAQHASAHSTTEEEFDAAVDEAIKHVRRGQQ
jgi:hypothetical protein